MTVSIKERLRSYGSSAVRLAAALTMAAICIGIIGFAANWAYTYPEREQAKQAAVMRTWSDDLSPILGMTVQAKTKVTDAMLQMVLEFDGHPEFLNQTGNLERGFFLEWQDANGFTHIKKFVKLSEFTRLLDTNGKPNGLSGQFAEFTSAASYNRVVTMKVGWNLTTEAPQAKAPQPADRSDSSGDHCAPGISRQERLRRLAKHGQIRETGYGEYTAGIHSVNMMPYDGSLLHCR